MDITPQNIESIVQEKNTFGSTSAAPIPINVQTPVKASEVENTATERKRKIPSGSAKKKRKGGHGRRKIEIKYIENKSRRQTTFSKRKSGLLKKAYELSTLTGTEAIVLICSETGHVYSFSTSKFQPFIQEQKGKSLIRTLLSVKLNDENGKQVIKEDKDEERLVTVEKDGKMITSKKLLQETDASIIKKKVLKRGESLNSGKFSGRANGQFGDNNIQENPHYDSEVLQLIHHKMDDFRMFVERRNEPVPHQFAEMREIRTKGGFAVPKVQYQTVYRQPQLHQQGYQRYIELKDPKEIEKFRSMQENKNEKVKEEFVTPQSHRRRELFRTPSRDGKPITFNPLNVEKTPPFIRNVNITPQQIPHSQMNYPFENLQNHPINALMREAEKEEQQRNQEPVEINPYEVNLGEAKSSPPDNIKPEIMEQSNEPSKLLPLQPIAELQEIDVPKEDTNEKEDPTSLFEKDFSSTSTFL